MTRVPDRTEPDDAADPPCEAPAMPAASPEGARLLAGSGARATENLLFERLAPLVAVARADVRLLATPVRVVVPSRSLREHVSAAIVRHFGAAVAGVEVQTLQRLAREILERAYAPARPAEALVPVLVRAAARSEPVLARDLGALDDGFGAVLGTVRDLLDAGRLRESEEAIDDALAALPGHAAERARVLVRVGVTVTKQLERLGIDSRASLLARAADALSRDAARTLPRRAVFVHGFADATGVATDLIEALVRTCGAVVLIDRPPDPADPSRADLGCAFSDRFTGRLASAAGPVAVAPQAAPPSEIRLLEAAGTAAEVRGVARRIRTLLDRGVEPESIGVVARTLRPYAAALREDFGQLGIPFSALSATSGPDAAGRRIDAILTLLERGGDTAADRWLSALAPRCFDGALLADLRLALHALGAARLSQVAALDVERRLRGGSSYALPARHDLGLAEDENGELRPHADRRRVPARALCSLADRAAKTCEMLSTWPGEAGLGEHLRRADVLLREGLGLREGDDADARPLPELTRLAGELPAHVPIDRASLRLVLRDAFAPLRSHALGGAGAGVQVLDATEARARTFERLFVVGLGRDVFPRIVLEDPLLPDALRRALGESGAGVLPDLPLKLGGLDEERYLFAQLVSASPHTTLSWQSVGDDGKERAPSTLVERIRLEERAPGPARLPALWSSAAGEGAPSAGEGSAAGEDGDGSGGRDDAGPRPAAEHLVLAGLHAGRDAVTSILPLALAEAVSQGAAGEAVDVAAVARGRSAALEMLEPRGAAREQLGPGLGFVGERGEGGLREAALAVTTLEDVALCPWRAFLSRVLHLEPAPDALAELPAVDALALGSVLHESIAAIVDAAISPPDRSLDAALARGSRKVPWPPDAELRDVVRERADHVLTEQGLFAPGLARVLAERTERLAREVFEQIWRPAHGAPALFGAELDGALRLRDGGGAEREIRFRADLVEQAATGLRLVDLKAGRSYTNTKVSKTQRAHLLARIAKGTVLQAAVYALATGGEGAYLFADRERAPECRLASIGPADPDVTRIFEETARTLLAAWDRGSFVPRLVLPDGVNESKSPCRTCELSEACSHGDTGARQRMKRWAKARGGEAGPAAAALAAARAAFSMPAAAGAADEEDRA